MYTLNTFLDFFLQNLKKGFPRTGVGKKNIFVVFFNMFLQYTNLQEPVAAHITFENHMFYLCS